MDLAQAKKMTEKICIWIQIGLKTTTFALIWCDFFKFLTILIQHSFLELINYIRSTIIKTAIDLIRLKL
jgi:hypothetical protein